MAQTTFEGYRDRLRSRLFGLLREREKNGEWEKFLDTITLEILGLYPEENRPINVWALLGKLNILRFLNFPYFRKLLLDCVDLVGGLHYETREPTL